MAKFMVNSQDIVIIDEVNLRNLRNDNNCEDKPKNRFRVEHVKETAADCIEDFDNIHEQYNDNRILNKPLSHAAKRVISESGRIRMLSESSGTNHDTVNLNNDFDDSDGGKIKEANFNTIETLPHVDHYKNLFSATNINMKQRPTLDELREFPDDNELDRAVGDFNIFNAQKNDDKQNPNSITPLAGTNTQSDIPVSIKFGWIKGVLIRCLLNIWGVMLFIRISWIVGQAGIGLTIVIIALSSVVTVITTLSMSAICTNGEVKGGGAYFLISRTLGPEIGGAVGLIFSLANAVAVSMYIVGFSETVRDILKENNRLMVDEINDVRIIGVITVVVILIITLIGMEWESRTQIILLAILLLALVGIFIGSFIPDYDNRKLKGFTGYKFSTLKDNLKPDFRNGESFFSVFAIFFPAATGILAGANISGDLKNAQKAIPKGTLVAILITSVTYVIISIIAGSCTIRDAFGPVEMNSTYNNTCINYKCKFGLQNDMQVMQKISVWGPIVISGIFAATLSSALASFLSAPKVFKAVCDDKIFPKIHIFAKPYGKSGDPRLAYMLTFFISTAFILIGDLNQIAPLISNCFLMSYALINYSCFNASFAGNPGWRPSFRYYKQNLALIGAILCVGMMFVILWYMALVTVFIIVAIYYYLYRQKLVINWGTSEQARIYKTAINSTLKLNNVQEHIKNYRPQIFVLTGHPLQRPDLTKFAATIAKSIGLVICGHVIVGDEENYRLSNMRRSKLAYDWFSYNNLKCFYNSVCSKSLRDGVAANLQSCGLGKLKPNIFLVGFKQDWKTSLQKDVHEYVGIIHDALDLRYGVGIIRVDGGFFVQRPFQDEGIIEDERILLRDSSVIDFRDQSKTNVDKICESQVSENINPKSVFKITGQLSKASKKKGYIDVWWLFDDGGLTLLIPYILSSNWDNCKLRVFGAASKTGELDRDLCSMATLLSKFRIDYASIKIIPDIGGNPSLEGIQRFSELIEPWMLKENESIEISPWKVTEIVLDSLKEKTYRQIRLRELLQEHSINANLIVITLPMPRKTIIPSGLYMAWIETISKDMPPILLLRGNQESVLTFYS